MCIWVSFVWANTHPGHGGRRGPGNSRLRRRIADRDLRGICLRKKFKGEEWRRNPSLLPLSLLKDPQGLLYLRLPHFTLPGPRIVKKVFRHPARHAIGTQVHHLHARDMSDNRQPLRQLPAQKTPVRRIMLVTFIIAFIVTLHNPSRECIVQTGGEIIFLSTAKDRLSILPRKPQHKGRSPPLLG